MAYGLKACSCHPLSTNKPSCLDTHGEIGNASMVDLETSPANLVSRKCKTTSAADDSTIPVERFRQEQPLSPAVTLQQAIIRCFNLE